MTQIYRYTVDRPNIVNPRVRVVDYIGLLSANGKEWSTIMSTLVPTKSNDSRRTNRLYITVTYSFTRIKNFPIDTLEGELTIKLNDTICMGFNNNPKYNIIVDPYGSRNLVMEFTNDVIMDLHNTYIDKGAMWPFGVFTPHVVIESGTLYKEEDLNNLAIPDNLEKLLVFNTLSFSRFGENLDAFPET